MSDYDYDDIDGAVGAIDDEIAALEAELDDEVGLFRNLRMKGHANRAQRWRRRAQRAREKGHVKIARRRSKKARKHRFIARKLGEGWGRGRIGARGRQTGWRGQRGIPKRRVVVRRGAGGRFQVQRPRHVVHVVHGRRPVLQATGRPVGTPAPTRPLGVPLGWFQPPGAPGSARPPGFTPMPGGPVPLGEWQQGFAEEQAFQSQQPEEPGEWEGGYDDGGYGEPAEEVEYVDEFGAPIDPSEIEFIDGPLSSGLVSLGAISIGALDDEIAALEYEVAKIKAGGGKKKRAV